jgi:hypothetical protein
VIEWPTLSIDLAYRRRKVGIEYDGSPTFDRGAAR